MPDDKSKKSSTTKKTSSANTKNGKNTPKKKKPTKAQLEQLRMEEEIQRAEYIKKRNQAIALVLMGAGLIFLSIVLIPASDETVWTSLRGVIFGLFGVSGFLLPLIMIYTAVMLTFEKTQKSFGVKLAEGLLLILFLSALMYVIFYNGDISFSKDVKEEFMNYFSYRKFGWGFFAAFIGETLMLIGSSKAPAIAILLIAVFLSFMFLTGFTLIKLYGSIEKPARKVEEKIERAKQENIFDRNYEDEIEKETRKPRKSHLYVYSEKDLLSDEDRNENAGKVHKEDPVKESVQEEKENSGEAYAENKDSQDNFIKDIFAVAEERQKQQEEKKLSKSEIEEEQQNVASEIDEAKEEKENDNYILPPLSCLRLPEKNSRAASQADLRATAEKLIGALKSFNVEASVTDVVPGPSVTRYEVAPAPGVKISKFTGLADDLALHLAAPAGVRIEAPIPNKSAIGIEIPNRGRTTVTMREIVDSDIYRKSHSKLNVALGKDIAGNVVCADLAKMPHLLIAGTTGSGKSVCLNAMIVSLLYNAKPSEVKLLLIDPKQVEFSVYNGIPHLLVPVVSDARKAAGALGWAVTEMLNRYKTLNDNGVRDIGAYNDLCDQDETKQKMSQIVIVIDELSDLMSVAPSEVEGSITRLAQMARAAGMHLVVATQRPSVDVITGLIKANIPSRIALSVSSQVDSRTIIDAAGAEKLLGLGDMLFYPVGMSKPLRVQGCYLSDSEIEKVVDFVKTQEATAYDDDIQQEIEKQALSAAPKKSSKDSEGASVSDADNEIIMKAAELVIKTPEKASISSLQRSLSLGFAKAGRIMDALEAKGVVGPHAGSKPRKVLMTMAQWYEMNAMSPDMASDEDTGENEDE